MKSPANSFLFAFIVGLSICSTAKAHDACTGRLLEKAARQERQARIDRWGAQRANIEILEKRGDSFRNLTRAYRSLIENLFETDALDRARIIQTVFANPNILNQLDLNLPVRRFTEDLIRTMSTQMNNAAVLAKLHVLADMQDEKLEDY